MNQLKVPRISGGKNKKTGKKKSKGKGKNKNGKVLTVGRVILLTFLSLLFVFLLSIVIFLYVYEPNIEVDAPDPYDDYEMLSPDDEEAATDGEGVKIPPPARNRGDSYTFLVIGTDSGLNTDTIMFVMFDVKDSAISILNVPRDTYVNMKKTTYKISGDISVTVDGHSGKINGAYAKGYNAGWRATQDREKAKEAGTKFLQETIKYTFGVPCDRYLSIDLGAFKFLVDKIDGVEFDVPFRMKYTDPYQDLYIDLQEGLQTLNGAKAEQLIRFRHGDPGYPGYGRTIDGVYYPAEDIGRIQTQQRFIAALAKKLFNFNKKTMDAMLKTASEYVRTDIILSDAGWFVTKAMSVKFENMRTHTVPGDWIGSVSRYEAYSDETMQIINKYYNPYNEDIPKSRVNIYDADVGTKYPVDIDGVTMDGLVK